MFSYNIIIPLKYKLKKIKNQMASLMGSYYTYPLEESPNGRETKP